MNMSIKWKYLILQVLLTGKKTSEGLDFCSLPKIDIWLDLSDLLMFNAKLSNQGKIVAI